VLEGSKYSRWSEVFSKVFDSESIALLGTYALKNEAEFFAVCSERFFGTPKLFKKHFPDIYQELKLFYRLDTEALFKDLPET